MFYILKKISWFIKKEWKSYAFMCFLLILISFVSLMPAYLLGQAIDVISSKTLNEQTLTLLVGGLVLVPVLRYMLSFMFHITVNKTAQKLSHELRKKYLDHLFEMDAEFYESYDKGDLIARVTNDLDAITVAATSLLEGVIFNVSVIFFAIGIMSITISLKLTLISVLIMPVGLSILNILRLNKRKYFKKHREIYADLTEKILESVEGQRTIRAYGQEANDLQKQYDAIETDITSWRYIVRFENWFNPMFEVIYGIAYVLAFAFGVYYIIQQDMTLGGLITFVSYIGMLYGPIIAISTIFTQINNAVISIDRFDQILEEKPKVHDVPTSKSIIDFSEIEFRNVTFKYPFEQNPSIKGVSFKIEKGQTIGIVGPTGAGKSTLIRQLLREFNVTDGQVYIDGESIEDYKIDDIRNLVGYVPQSHMLFKRGVHENILIGKPSADYQALDRAVKTADFEKDLYYLQDGLNTMVGESGMTLSGGQKQRLSIARALIKEPQILILDDSLSAVDATTEDNIIRKLKETRAGKTNIIVAHRFSAIKAADVIIVLQAGVITQMGSHEELLRVDGWYKNQYITQMTVK